MPVDLEGLQSYAERGLEILINWATSPQFYAQVGAIVVAVTAATLVARKTLAAVPFFKAPPEPGPLYRLRQAAYATRDMLLAIFAVLALAVAVQATESTIGASWLIRIAQSVAVVNVLYTAISRYLTHPILRAAGLYLVIPIAALKVFGWFDETMSWLDAISLEAGNIRISLLALLKAGIFGSALFWLGRISNDAGQRVIRKQEALDLPTRELFAKLFQIALFCACFILLLQLLGLDLTALAIFGGALGVGIGFGLQQIAANFISGIIILLERSLRIGDYVEMEGGKAGLLKELNLRSATLATFDGKEILVPNEKLITTSVVNWTRAGTQQRQEVQFMVGHDTDVESLVRIIRDTVSTHPGVLNGMGPADCQLRSIGEKGLTFVVEFWVDGVAGGPHKVPSDVRLCIWEALRKHKIPLPRA